MYSISPGLYTCTVYHLVYIHDNTEMRERKKERKKDT